MTTTAARTDTFTAEVSLSIDRQHVLDHVFGSGAIEYHPWWHSVELTADRQVLVITVDDPKKDEGTPKTTREMVKWVAEAMIRHFGGKAGTSIDRDGNLDLDLDAEDVDWLLQMVVFDEQVYS